MIILKIKTGILQGHHISKSMFNKRNNLFD